MKDYDENYFYDFHDTFNSVLLSVWSEWLRARKKPKAKRGFQKWSVVGKSDLVSTWNSYAKYGFVRDDEKLDSIASQIVENSAKINANTILMGHDQLAPNEALTTADGSNDEMSANEFERLAAGFEDFAIDPVSAQWRLSDSNRKINDFAFDIFSAKDSRQKMSAIDILLNFSHPRSDLASWFVQGGSDTLSQLRDA